MEKTIKINLAGVLFQIDQDAYKMLHDYLLDIDMRFRNAPGGNETFNDIEIRIAEIFQAQQGIAGVISKQSVEAMIRTIGKPQDFDFPENSAGIPSSTLKRRKLFRNNDDLIISGVCGGLGAYLNLNPVWVRIFFILIAIFYGLGFLVYLALWIALPKALNDSQKRELYGEAYRPAASVNKQKGENNTSPDSIHIPVAESTDRFPNAINEVFRAIGKAFFILFRVILVIIGVLFVLTGFVVILSFIMVFFIKSPGFISYNTGGSHLFYLPDFLNYIIPQSVTPWVIGLTFLVVALPLTGLVYSGIKMIFWFRANDRVIGLIGLVAWVLCISSLVIILFNEGISFKERGRTSSQIVLQKAPDTLYVITDKKVADLHFNKEIDLPGGEYSVYIVDEKKELDIRSHLRLDISDDNSAKIEVIKRSSGRSKMNAVEKAENLIYSFSVRKDTLYLDEYFTLPYENKWAGDDITINLYLPEGTILYFDKTSENLFQDVIYINSEVDHDTNPWDLGNRYWVISDKGLRESAGRSITQK